MAAFCDVSCSYTTAAASPLQSALLQLHFCSYKLLNDAQSALLDMQSSADLHHHRRCPIFTGSLPRSSSLLGAPASAQLCLCIHLPPDYLSCVLTGRLLLAGVTGHVIL